MRRLAMLLMYMMGVYTAMAKIVPDTGTPWVKIQTAKTATINPLDLDDTAKAHITLHYLNSFGQTIQTIDIGASPLKKDIVSGVQTRDEIGRPVKSYLPAPMSTADGRFYTHIEAAAQNFYNDTKPYSKVAEYEASPFSRVLKTLAPGEAFQTAGAPGTRHDFEVAGTGIRRYRFIDENTAGISGNYANGQLIKTWLIDEDGNESIEYHGAKSGRLIQRHQKSKNSSELLITAYVYDFMGRLRFIIPPKLYNAGVTVSATSHAEGLYVFRYDERSRLVESQKPGAGAEYTVYNSVGQVVMSQDARQRESNT